MDADHTGAAEVASMYTYCQSPTPTSFVCPSQCSNLLVAASICSDSQCSCPTFLASGSACSACLVSSGDPTDAAAVESIMIHCQGNVPASATATTGQSPSTHIASVTPASTQAKSGAYGFRAQVFGVVDIQMIMFIAVVTALVGIFL